MIPQRSETIGHCQSKEPARVSYFSKHKERNSQSQRDLEEISQEYLENRVNELVAKKLKLIKQHLSSQQHLNRPLFAMKSVSIDKELK